MYSVGYDLLSDPVREAKVKEDVKQAFLGYLFFINSNDKKHSQLKKTVANDHAKGDGEAFPSSCHVALTLMNDFKPLIIEGPAPVAAQDTSFAQKQKGAGTPATGTECNFNKEYFATRNASPVVRRGTQQDVAHRRKARLRRIRRTTSRFPVTSLLKQSSP